MAGERDECRGAKQEDDGKERKRRGEGRKGR